MSPPEKEPGPMPELVELFTDEPGPQVLGHVYENTHNCARPTMLYRRASTVTERWARVREKIAEKFRTAPLSGKSDDFVRGHMAACKLILALLDAENPAEGGKEGA